MGDGSGVDGAGNCWGDFDGGVGGPSKHGVYVGCGEAESVIDGGDREVALGVGVLVCPVAAEVEVGVGEYNDGCPLPHRWCCAPVGDGVGVAVPVLFDVGVEVCGCLGGREAQVEVVVIGHDFGVVDGAEDAAAVVAGFDEGNGVGGVEFACQDTGNGAAAGAACW